MAGAAQVPAAVIAPPARPRSMAEAIGPTAYPATPATAPVKAAVSAERTGPCAPTTFTTASAPPRRPGRPAAAQHFSWPTTAFTRVRGPVWARP